MAVKSNSATLNVRLFSIPLRIVWTALLLVAVCLEISPPFTSYAYEIVMALIFILAGFLSPLSFSRFNWMNGGVVAAASVAVLVEIFRGLTQHGYSVHFIAMALNLLFTAAGFGIGIVSRYDRRIGLGPVRVLLNEGRS